MTAEEFKELRLKLGLTQKDLGEKLKLSKWQIINYETGKVAINPVNANKLRQLAGIPFEEQLDSFTQEVEILKEFYGVKSLDGVAEKMGYSRGVANTWRKKREISAKAKLQFELDKQKQQKTQTLSKEEMHSIPYYSYNSYFEGDKEMMLLPQNYVLQHIGVQENVFTLCFEGDSMLPTIKEGDILFVRKEVSHIVDGKIYVIRRDKELFCRRLYKDALKDSYILKGDNANFPSFDIAKEMLEQGVVCIEGEVFKSLSLVSF